MAYGGAIREALTTGPGRAVSDADHSTLVLSPSGRRHPAYGRLPTHPLPNVPGGTAEPVARHMAASWTKGLAATLSPVRTAVRTHLAGRAASGAGRPFLPAGSLKELTMNRLITAAALVAITSLAACKDEKVSFQTLEDARAQGRANAEFNAQLYRAENPRFTDHKIVSHGDSTQSPECPQGDGWASVSLLSVHGKDVEKYSLKCSTVSQALGCYLESDFIKKPFAAEENKCQETSRVPHPLPKLGK